MAYLPNIGPGPTPPPRKFPPGYLLIPAIPCMPDPKRDPPMPPIPVIPEAPPPKLLLTPPPKLLLPPLKAEDYPMLIPKDEVIPKDA